MPRRSILAVLVVSVAACAVVARGAPADEVAGPRLSTVLAGLGSPRVDVRRASLARLEALAGREAVLLTRAARPLGDVLRRRPSEEAARAALLLARLPGPRARRHWLRALDPDRDPRVFRAAVEGAAFRRSDPEALRALIDRLREAKASEAERALALEALGSIGGGVARSVLVHPQPGSDGLSEGWLLAAGRALGLQRLGGRVAVEALLPLLDHAHAAVRVHAWEGLVQLTRQRLPPESRAWRAWWEAHPDALGTPVPPGIPAADPGPDRYATSEPVHIPTYYGVPISRPRSHVVFCLDVSQSMYGRGIEQARTELERTLKAFPTTYAFDVIAFNERIHPFAGRLVPAHPVVKQRVLAWLARLETISYTNLYDAVETAFGYAGIGRRAADSPVRLDAIFLLSDGAPNRGRYRREDRVVDAIGRLCRRRIPVHAVAAGEEVFPLLRRIAAETGGRFVDAFEFE